MVRDEVLAKVASPELRVYVVWLPILDSDTRAAAEQAAGVIADRDRRVSQFWDEGKALGLELGRVLDIPSRRPGAGPDDRGVAWDVYLLYPRSAAWQASAPAPGFWMHQLSDLDERKVPPLDGATLRERVLGGS